MTFQHYYTISKWFVHKALLSATILSTATAAENIIHDTDKDIFTITDTVRYKDAEDFRFGMNLSTVRSFSGWNSDYMLNCFTKNTGFEPIISQHGWIADGGGADFLEHNTGAGLHWWDCIGDDYWNGGECWIYRIENGKYNLLRKSIVKKCISGRGAENRLYFTEKGPAVRSGDVYSLRKTFYTSPKKFATDRMKEKTHPKTGIVQSSTIGGGKVNSQHDWLLDSQHVCPEGGSTTSLKIEFSPYKDKNPNCYTHEFVTDVRRTGYFYENKEYKFEVWLRQEGSEDGLINIEFGPFFKQTVTVTDQWKKYEGTLNTDTYSGLAKLIDAELNNNNNEALRALNNQLLELAQWDGAPDYDKQEKFGRRIDSDNNLESFWSGFVEECAIRQAYITQHITAAGGDAQAIANEKKHGHKLQKQIDSIADKTPAELAELPTKKRNAFIKIAKQINKKLGTTEWNSAKGHYQRQAKILADQMIQIQAPSDTLNTLLTRLSSVIPKPLGYSASTLKISGTSGTLWIDNLLVWQTDVPKFGVMPWVQESLKNMRPGMTRIWKGLATASVDAWIKDKFQAPRTANFNSIGSYNAFSLGESLTLCAQSGSNPWLILNPYWSGDELEGLMEYLYAPATIGYGKIRAEQGHPTPWADDFPTIYIECANEPWNSMFAPKAWSGNPEVYARIADYQFRTMKASSYFNHAQMKFVLGGRQDTRRGGWSQTTASFSQEADYQDFASYFGGWDGMTVLGADDEALLNNQIMYGPQIIDPPYVRAMNIDPNLHEKMALVLANDEDLLNDLFDSLPLTGDSLVVSGTELITQVESVTLTDMSIDNKSISRLKESINSPSTLSLMASVQDPDIEKTIFPVVFTGLAPHLLKPLALACSATSGENSFYKRAEKIGEGNIALYEQWIANITTTDPAAAGLQKRLLQGHDKYMQTKKPGYDNRMIAAKMVHKVVDAFHQHPELIPRIKETFSYYIGFGKMRAVNTQVDMILAGLSTTVAHKLLLAMKNDRTFAQQVITGLHTDDSFLDNTAAALAKTIVHTVTPVLSGTQPLLDKKGKAVPEKVYPISHLPEPLRSDLFAFIKECASLDVSQVDPVIPRITTALITAAEGDESQMKALSTNPLFIQSVKTRIMNSFADTCLDIMGSDGGISIRMESALKQLPEDPRVIKRATYEAGPGYLLPGAGKSSPEESESLGKSQLMGVTTIDIFLANLSKGFGPQGYFTFSTGDYWSTHNNALDLFPHASFQSLAMHNQYCRGDMMDVTYNAVRSVDIPDKKGQTAGMFGFKEVTIKGRKNIPLSMCYAYKKGETHSILLINRNINDTRTVQLHLPYTPSAHAKLYFMYTKDPMAGNRKEYLVKEQMREITDFKNGYEYQLPPHSFAIFVNKEK